MAKRGKLCGSKYGGSAGVKVRFSQGYHQCVAQVNHTLCSAVRRREETERKHRAELAALTFAERDTLNRMAVDDDAWEDEAPPVLPFGEEGMFLSAAGGEHTIWEEFFKDEKCPRKDARTRRERTHIRTQEWQQQIGRLVDGYLAWKAGIIPRIAADAPPPWDVTLVDFWELQTDVVNPASWDEYPNESLARCGYLGTAPLRPSVAIAFRTLEAYRQLHYACPRLSIQAQVRALCRLHAVTYNRTLEVQFSIAYDVYLEILRHVDSRVDALQDKPPLKYSMLVTMDGNQSLKLVDDAFRAQAGTPLRDDRLGCSKNWLTPAEVDRWKDEVSRP
ncbi:hypothetical protein FOMPIDRAFT_1045594, partial [Fomitopsis schrenkii]